MKKRKYLYLMIVFFIIGIILLLYPIISTYYNSRNFTNIRQMYNKQVNTLSNNEKQKLLSDAKDFNDYLNNLPNQFSLEDKDYLKYKELLSFNENGIMGFLTIPSIGVDLPIYHGVENYAISNGVGHLEGSSLPIEDKSTNIVLSSHSNSMESVLFSSLDLLEKGDIFIIDSLGSTLTYKVENIWVVERTDFTHLYTRSNEELCTLVTCTPKGINDKLLMVQGKRTDYNKNYSVENKATVQNTLMYLVPIFITLLCIVIICTLYSKKLFHNK